jgi:hypothetical protein
MTGESHRFSAGPWDHGQRVPGSRVGDVADDHDLFQLADALDPRLLMGGREAGRKSVPAGRRSARTEKHDIVRRQREQADQIAGIDGID